MKIPGLTAAFAKHHRCGCPRCREFRRVERMVCKLKPRDRTFFRNLYHRFVHLEMTVERAGTGEN